MAKTILLSAASLIVLGVGVLIAFSQVPQAEQPLRQAALPTPGAARLPQAETDALEMIREGRQIFRQDTFGDEAFWGDALQLHAAVAGEKLGGVGAGLS